MRKSTALPSKSPYERLRDAIIRGNIAPGMRLVELDVAHRLGISRTPAREAIKRLYQDGFLLGTKSGPRTTFTVAPLTRDDMLDLYAIMAGLEGSAARNVRRLDASARRDLGRRLREVNNGFVEAASSRARDYDRMFELHNAFHDVLVNAVATPRLRALIEHVRPQVHRYEYVYAPTTGPDHEATFEEHDAIIRAVIDAAPSVVESKVRANWINSGERLEAAFDRLGPRGAW